MIVQTTKPVFTGTDCSTSPNSVGNGVGAEVGFKLTCFGTFVTARVVRLKSAGTQIGFGGFVGSGVGADVGVEVVIGFGVFGLVVAAVGGGVAGAGVSGTGVAGTGVAAAGVGGIVSDKVGVEDGT